MTLIHSIPRTYIRRIRSSAFLLAYNRITAPQFQSGKVFCTLIYTAYYVEPLFENRKPKIAVARDEAFCFIYKDNIALLEKLGCQIEFFSPIHDCQLPSDISGLILYGGYPEHYLEKLSSNKTMLNSIRCAVNSGIPTIAECGGFMASNQTHSK